MQFVERVGEARDAGGGVERWSFDPEGAGQDQ
jgi:hypothetical protein